MFTCIIINSGTQASMERYGQLLERAIQSQMHEDVPSDCEDWRTKTENRNRLKSSTNLSSNQTPLPRKSLQSKLR